MESKLKVADPEELMPRIKALVDQGQTVPLVISGGSMVPFLVHGRDTVYLSAPDRPLKRGDMILYRRDSGAYILHRICAVREDIYDLIGDAQTVVEPGIRKEQVLALVTAVRRKGKLLQTGSFLWMLFEKLWIRMIPLRPALLRMYRRLTRR